MAIARVTRTAIRTITVLDEVRLNSLIKHERTITMQETVDANGNIWTHIETDHDTIAHYKNGELVSDC